MDLNDVYVKFSDVITLLNVVYNQNVTIENRLAQLGSEFIELRDTLNEQCAKEISASEELYDEI